MPGPVHPEAPTMEASDLGLQTDSPVLSEAPSETIEVAAEDIPTVESLADTAQEVLEEAQQQNFELFKTIDTVIRNRNELVDQGVDKVADVISSVGQKALKAVVTGWKKFTNVVNPKSVAKFATKAAVHPVTAGTVAGIAGYKNEPIRSTAEAAVQATSEFAQGFLGNSQAVAEQVSAAPQAVSPELVQMATPSAEQILQEVAPQLADPVAQSVPEAISQVGETVAEVAQPVVQAVPTEAAQAGEAARTLYDQTISTASEFGKQAYQQTADWVSQRAAEAGNFIVDKGPDALATMAAGYLVTESATLVAGGIKPTLEAFKRSVIAVGETLNDVQEAFNENGPKKWALELASKVAAEFVGNPKTINRIVKFIDGPVSLLTNAAIQTQIVGEGLSNLESALFKISAKVSGETAKRLGGRQNRPGGLRYLAKSFQRIAGGDNIITTALVNAENTVNEFADFSKAEAASAARSAENASKHKAKADHAATILAQLQTLTSTSNPVTGWQPSPLHKSLKEAAGNLAMQRAKLAEERKTTWDALSAKRGARATAGNMVRSVGTVLSQTGSNWVRNSITTNALQGRLPNWTKTAGTAIGNTVSAAVSSARQNFSTSA